MYHTQSEEQEQIDKNHVVAVMGELRRAMQSRVEAGLVPVDGLWMPTADARKAARDALKRSRVHAVEVLVLFGANLFVSLLILALVRALCY